MTFPYYVPKGGLPPQTDLRPKTDIIGKSHFTPSYAVIDRHALADITASRLPQWNNTRLWVLARPMTGFSETFCHYIMEVTPGGGSSAPEPSPDAEAVLFVVTGKAVLELEDESHNLTAGSYAYIPPEGRWRFFNVSTETVTFHWIRKRYQPAPSLEPPPSFVTSDAATTPIDMPDTDGLWSTTCFVDADDLRHDMHVNIVNLESGGCIPFAETHVMEHGLYMLEGMADYYVNRDWIHVEAGDYLWLRAFSPQACRAVGPSRFRYLLYKDVNRHMPLTPAGLGG
jgi:(S)-ureidoglycine aminohydrolase